MTGSGSDIVVRISIIPEMVPAKVRELITVVLAWEGVYASVCVCMYTHIHVSKGFSGLSFIRISKGIDFLEATR